MLSEAAYPRLIGVICINPTFYEERKVNKSEFVTALAAEMNTTKAEATKTIDSFLQVIKTTLKQGDELRLVGFGTFKVSQVPAKTVNNPQNRNQKIHLPATNRVKFAPGKELKQAVNS